MKLTLAVVRDDDADKVVDALVSHGFYVTRLTSTGGFLRMGNTVLMSGVEDDQLDKMLKVIRSHTQIHIQPPGSRILQETRVSRAVVFVLGLEQMEKLLATIHKHGHKIDTIHIESPQEVVNKVVCFHLQDSEKIDELVDDFKSQGFAVRVRNR